MNNLTGKVAIVTGASKGIGAQIAIELAAAGAAVAVNYASSKDGADRAVATIVAAGGRAVAVGGDVSKIADVKRVYAETVAALGAPSILVNNAGAYTFGPLEDVTEAEFHRQFDINVLGPMLMTQEALKNFPQSGGSVINISSVVSKFPMPNAAIYAATKGAIDTLSGVLALELGARNIRVNTVAPGVTVTEGLEAVGFVGSEFETMMADRTPIGKRVGTPRDIAPTVVFLASDDAAWLTGERLNVSGGLH